MRQWLLTMLGGGFKDLWQKVRIGVSGNFQVLAAAVAGLAEGQERPVSGGHWAASWAAQDDLTSPAEELVLSMHSHRCKVNFHAMPARASRMPVSILRT